MEGVQAHELGSSGLTRSSRVLLAVVAAQAALLGAYWLVERARSPERGPEAQLGTAPPLEVTGQAPQLSIRGRAGTAYDLRMIERPTLVHFWATWCPPCRAELPGLLALPASHPVDVVAVALDREWAVVDRFLGGRRPATVFLGDSAEVERALGVRTLPVTYLLGPGGQLRLRFDGARDWTDAAFLDAFVHGLTAP